MIYRAIAMLMVSSTLCGVAIAQNAFSHANGPANSGPRPLLAQANRPNASAQQNSLQQNFHPRGEGPHRGDWLRKYGNLPPGQLEKQLEQDKQFQSLSVDHQQLLKQRLERFNSLPIEKKQRILNRMELIEHMPPDQQQRVEALYQQFHALQPERRQVVVQQLRQLRAMPVSQRQKALDSEQFKSGFNEQEQQIIRGLNDLGSQLEAAGAKGPGL